jgi:hypothetical protein
MLTSYQVGAVLTVVDEASPVLRRISGEFEALNRAIKQVKESLGTLRLPSAAGAGSARQRMWFEIVREWKDKRNE